MKQHILPAIKLTIICLIFFAGIYTLLILGIAQVAPNKGNGETIAVNGKTIGYALEGQSFTQDKYFWSRPSAVGYNAAGSGGSNKGPSNPGYLKQVQDRLDTFLVHNPGVSKSAIPSELITASGSGLDPDLSPAGAKVQIKRIAAVRKIDENKINGLVEQNIQQPFLGLFGTSKVNVLKQAGDTLFAGVNSGLNHFIRPMFYGAYHEIENISNPSGEKQYYNVVGNICETDTFAVDRRIAEVVEGDIIGFYNAGAYGWSMASQFNTRI